MRYRQAKRWGDTSVGEGPSRISYFTGDMPAATKMKLQRYRLVAPIEV